MQPLTLKEFKEYAKNNKRGVVFTEIAADNWTPISIYHLLSQFYQQDGIILEDLYQGQASKHRRYAYICFDIIQSLSIPYGSSQDALNALRDLNSELQYKTRPDVEPLITKAIGFMTYDAVNSVDDKKNNTLPLCSFHFYALNITFDYERKTFLISMLTEINKEKEIDEIYNHANKKIQHIIAMITKPASAMTVKSYCKDKTVAVGPIENDVSDIDYMGMVDKAKEYIKCGDVFQIVISRNFKRRYSVSPLVIYEKLRQVSPSPFLFYFPTPTQTLIGASPERLVRIYQKEVTINPIAGTYKHTHDQLDSDETIRNHLLNDKKELAEHMMLVDLARNDVGAVSKPGSVKVDELLKIKHYAHVSHITSSITGELQEKYDAFDAVRAAIPAGTLSGAPKIRAMQIIAELEKNARGLYGGAICRLDLANNIDSCIAIRMAVLQDGIATVRAGAGIVYDSDPYMEAQETYYKARAVLDAIAKAHEE